MLLAIVPLVGCVRPAPTSVDEATLTGLVPAAPAPVTPPVLDYVLHIPTQAQTGQPLTVVVALHGMGGNGPEFSSTLIEDAERHGWLLVAPTLNYRDWRDPEQVRQDGGDILPALKQTLDELPARTGLAIRDKALLYGFSRGGQTAHRFALFYPDAVLGVASFSCGTYTLPATKIRVDGVEQPLKFPYGVADLGQYQRQGFDLQGVRDVKFWLGVGARDNVAAEVPRQWDAYLGTNRVERARAFARSLEQLGSQAQLAIFPDATHELTDEMRAQAVGFLSSALY